MSSERCVVVGVGNSFRRDDSAGLYVAERLQDPVPDGVEVLTLEGEPTTLLDVFAQRGAGRYLWTRWQPRPFPG